MVKSAKECIKQHVSNSELYGRMQAVLPKELEDLKGSCDEGR